MKLLLGVPTINLEAVCLSRACGHNTVPTRNAASVCSHRSGILGDNGLASTMSALSMARQPVMIPCINWDENK